MPTMRPRAIQKGGRRMIPFAVPSPLNAQRLLLIASLCFGSAAVVASGTVERPADQRAANGEATDCDRAAASEFDAGSPVAGTPFKKIDPNVAIPACLEAVSKAPDSARANFELGRAY